MAAYKTEQINVGSIAAPDIGKDLINLGSTLRDNFQTGVANTRNAIADQRAKELFDRQTNEYNREIAGRQALQDYASKPLDTTALIGSQRALADEALVNDSNNRLAKWDASLKANNVTQDQIDKGLVSKEVLGKLYNPAYDEKTSTGIEKTYESITPFREDVETKVEKDLIAKNVDPLKAKQYAQMEGAKYQSIPEYQQFLNTQAEKATANEQARFKDTLELEKFKREAYKDELDKYKTKMEMLYKGMGAAGGTTGGGTGGIIGGQDKSKAYEKAYTKAGNEEELAKRLDAAFTKYGARAVNNALAASGIDEPVRLLEWDVGRRDVSLDRFDKALANEKPLSEIQGQFNSGIPEAPTYGLPGVARVYTPESARAAAQGSAKDRLMQVLGGSESAPNGITTSSGSNSVGAPALGKTSTVTSPVKGVPNSLLLNEGAKVDSNGNYVISEDIDSKGNKQGAVIGYGYNLKQHKDDIATDFKAAGIPQYKIDAAIRGDNFSLDKNENDALTKVIYPKYGTSKAERLIGKEEYSRLDPYTKEIANDMAFRGDLVPGENGYRGDLVNVIRKGDVNDVYKYISTMPVPNEVRTRVGNILTTERSRNEVLGTSDSPSTSRPEYTSGMLAEDFKKLPREERLKIISNNLKDNKEPSKVQQLLDNSESDLGMKAQNYASDFYQKNGEGFANDNEAIVMLQRNYKLSEKEAKNMYNDVKSWHRDPNNKIENIKGNPDDYLGNDNINNSSAIMDIIGKHYSNGAEEQLARQQATAEKVKQGLPLTENEKRWILEMSKTYKNNQVLKELGIK